MSKYVAESIINWFRTFGLRQLRTKQFCMQLTKAFANNQFAYIEECGNRPLQHYSLKVSCTVLT